MPPKKIKLATKVEPPSGAHDRAAWLTWRGVGVAAVAAILAALVARHTSPLNGPRYFYWAWRSLPAREVFGPLAIGLAMALVAQRIHHRGKMPIAVPLAILMLAMFSMTSLGVCLQSRPFGLDRMARIVVDPTAFSYFTDALRLSATDDWLARYHERSRGFALHSMTKPPGAIAFCAACVGWFGDASPIAIGLALVAVAAIIVPATYAMSCALGATRDMAFAAASLCVFMPGPVLMCPEFDQLYPVLACGMIGTWVASLARPNAWFAAAYGACLTVATFFAYNLLVLGAFLSAYSLCWFALDVRARWPRLVGHAAIALGVVAIGNIALWLATGYQPIATFHAALANQAYLITLIPRPYPATAIFDLTDFALGVGWLPMLLGGVALWRRFAERGRRDRLAWTIALVVLQLLLVAVTALLPGETARVWIFMMPLAAFAAGAELGDWGFSDRLAVYACMWLLLALVCQNMLFIAV